MQAPTITAQSQYTMQVFLQLPNGQTVPVQIPANSAGNLQVVQPSVMTSRVEQPMVNTIQQQTVILPAQTTTPVQSQTNITKQVSISGTLDFLSPHTTGCEGNIASLLYVCVCACVCVCVFSLEAS